MRIDHWLVEEFGQARFSKVLDIISRRKLARSFSSLWHEPDEDQLLKELLETFEFAAIDLWNSDDPQKKKTFIDICSCYLDICQVIELPAGDIEKIRFAIKLIVFGYLGERWESVRRYLIDKESQFLEISETNEWNLRLFRSIYFAIFHIVRKHQWQDLQRSIEMIRKLREEQALFEENFLNGVEIESKKGYALELVALYHLAKCVELVGEYQMSGHPNDVIEQLKFHFDYAIQYTEVGGNVELNLILRFLHPTFEKMVYNSLWMIGRSVNSRVTKFIERITKANKPIIELMYPQRHAILEGGLLDLAKQAIVVNMPTSSGKTLIAEFRILLALNQFADEKGWVAYVAPTRTLVNQIASRLRRDLSAAPLNLRVEAVSGALEIDAYEDALLSGGQENFDILVTTPEKLSLLIRQGVKEKIGGRPLALVVVDEAHNIADKQRGMAFEMLLSVIKNDFNESVSLLLLTPFVPNAKDVAEWLNPQAHSSITIEINWRPNDQVIGMFYADGSRRNVVTKYKSLLTNRQTLQIPDEIKISESHSAPFPVYQLKKTKRLLTGYVASQFQDEDTILVIARTKPDTYKIAEQVFSSLPDSRQIPSEVKVVQKFVASELGEDFPLVRLLNKRIGVHHAGLSDETKSLMEMLMEDEKLHYLVATTTIAQGINFPVSILLMASYAYPYTERMPISDFYNLAGRVGRVHQAKAGIIGIASSGGVYSKSGLDIIDFVKKKSDNIVSILVKMIREAMDTADELNMAKFFNRPEWSTFLQYIAHIYRQSQDLSSFQAQIELSLRKTFGYQSLNEREQEALIIGIRQYTQGWLDKRTATLSDLTGFSPNSVKLVLQETSGITMDDFNKSTLFTSNSQTLRKLVGIMLRAPEIKKDLDAFVEDGSDTLRKLPNIISDWVSGMTIPELAKRYFKGKDDTEKITRCVTDIYGRLTRSASWGLSAVQHLSGLNFDRLSEEEQRQMANLPSMIYYGVSTDEAIALRRACIPRAIAPKMGVMLGGALGKELYSRTTSDIIDWLNELSPESWHDANPKKNVISGAEYKQIWQRLAGVE